METKKRKGKRSNSLAFFVCRKEKLLITKEIIAFLAIFGLVIDFTPGIKIYPTRWIIKKIGSLMNDDSKEQLDKIEKDFQDHKIES